VRCRVLTRAIIRSISTATFADYLSTLEYTTTIPNQRNGILSHWRNVRKPSTYQDGQAWSLRLHISRRANIQLPSLVAPSFSKNERDSLPTSKRILKQHLQQAWCSCWGWEHDIYCNIQTRDLADLPWVETSNYIFWCKMDRCYSFQCGAMARQDSTLS